MPKFWLIGSICLKKCFIILTIKYIFRFAQKKEAHDIVKSTHSTLYIKILIKSETRNLNKFYNASTNTY